MKRAIGTTVRAWLGIATQGMVEEHGVYLIEVYLAPRRCKDVVQLPLRFVLLLLL